MSEPTLADLSEQVAKALPCEWAAYGRTRCTLSYCPGHYHFSGEAPVSFGDDKLYELEGELLTAGWDLQRTPIQNWVAFGLLGQLIHDADRARLILRATLVRLGVTP